MYSVCVLGSYVQCVWCVQVCGVYTEYIVCVYTYIDIYTCIYVL